jgi:hypothetical protein
LAQHLKISSKKKERGEKKKRVLFLTACNGRLTCCKNTYVKTFQASFATETLCAIGRYINQLYFEAR